MNFYKLTKHFGFTEKELGNLLYQVNAFIAGSSALNVFTNDKLYDGLDLDIFLRIPYTRENQYPLGEQFKNHYYPYEELAKDKIISLLESKGYELTLNKHQVGWLTDNKDTNEIEYMKCALSHFIKNIMTLTKDNKNIQIITIFDCTIDEFLDTFDLNICKLAIISCDGELNLYIQHLSQIEEKEILDRKMYIINPLYKANLKKRVAKYLGRGFDLVHCNTKEVIDEREIDDYICEAVDRDYITYDEFIKIKENKKKVEISDEEESIYAEDSDDETPVKIKCSEKDKITFSPEEIKIGLDYIVSKNVLLECVNYKFKDVDIANKQIMCLDDFELTKDIDANIDIKFGLEELIKTGSGYGLGVYMFQLIDYIQKLPMIETIIKEPNNNKLLAKVYIRDNNIIRINYYYNSSKYSSLDKVYESCGAILISAFENL